MSRPLLTAAERQGTVLLGRHLTAGRDRGTSALEYSLAMAGVAGLTLMAVVSLGQQLADVFDCMAQQLDGPTAHCGATGADPGAQPTGGTTGGAGDGTTGGGTDTRPTADPTGTTSTTSGSTTSGSTTSGSTTSGSTTTTSSTGTQSTTSDPTEP